MSLVPAEQGGDDYLVNGSMMSAQFGQQNKQNNPDEGGSNGEENEQKGTPTQPGIPSPYRNRPIEESLNLFYKMNTSEAEEGSMVLRAKLDMANPNMHFRDPIMYRIIHTPHHRTGTKWHAYPMYDFAHGQSDYFETTCMTSVLGKLSSTALTLHIQ